MVLGIPENKGFSDKRERYAHIKTPFHGENRGSIPLGRAILRLSTLLLAKRADAALAFRRYAADLRARVRGGAMRASAGMSHSLCSFQAILIVSERFLVRMSDAR